ncbi:MAG: family 16 glycosylhydrolase [Myxococcota bacterium]
MTPRICAITALLLSSCATTETEDRWKLVWQDNFEGAAGSAINADTWSFDVGIGPGEDGWGNQQLEYNTDGTNIVSLNGDGQLRIVARKEAFEGQDWTSGRIKTKDKIDFTYGAIEAGIKLPEGKGLWPAFWMLGANIDEVGWPTCGEIDIMEFRGNEPDTILGTIHGPGYSGGGAVGGKITSDEKWSDNYHIYRIEWDVQHIAWYVDGELYYTAHAGKTPAQTPWVFNHDFFLILNLAVGGQFLDNPDASTPVENEMLVDFVRVFERTEPFTDPLAVE